MISPQAFFNKYNGISIDFDHVYGNQCVDEINQYLVDVLDITDPIQTLPGPTALAIFQNCNSPRFEKILNTPTNFPVLGDLVFFSFNHVAVCILADEMSLTTFDQNYPEQGYTDKNGDFIGTGVCHFQEHSYGSVQNPTVLGWLRYKV